MNEEAEFYLEEEVAPYGSNQLGDFRVCMLQS